MSRWAELDGSRSAAVSTEVLAGPRPPYAGAAHLLRQPQGCGLIAAVKSGVAVADLTAALRRRVAERDELTARLERVERLRAMSAAQISELAKELGRLSTVLSDATAAERRGLREPRPAS